jgi:hypothetical protein
MLVIDLLRLGPEVRAKSRLRLISFELAARSLSGQHRHYANHYANDIDREVRPLVLFLIEQSQPRRGRVQRGFDCKSAPASRKRSAAQLVRYASPPIRNPDGPPWAGHLFDRVSAQTDSCHWEISGT